MNRSTQILAGIILITSGFGFSSCKKAASKSADKEQSVNIQIETLRPSRFVDAIQVVGTVKALSDANISPEEGGVVKEWVAKKGQYVKKGDIIIFLKDEVLKASYDAAFAQYQMAELNLEKQKKVYEEQGISELQYKNLVYARDAAKANADLMEARYERTRIKSPFNGIVDNILPNVGEFAPPGVPIVRVVNISVVKIQAEVPEKYSGSIVVGTSAIISFDALPGDTLEGKISFVSATVSSANRTLMVEIVVKNPYRKLKPEMIGKVKIVREVKTNAILINESIIQLVDRDRRIVYIENGGIAKECAVEIGGRQENRMEIVRGLHVGDRLIVSGYQKLVNGTPVVVTE
jgi:membrane fusion protein (multidrug efflux system)